MIKIIDKILTYTFYLFFLILPLILVPITSEIFEFNKIILVYLAVTLITFLWLVKIIIRKKLIFRRTILDIPLVIFLISQIITTFTSIDRYTSIFGYYSRFNGGLLSTFSFVLLYFAYTANMTVKKTKKVFLFLISSLSLVAIYGILEHYGIDKNLWVQDVQNRVFSTLGQPNWLAACLVAVIPLTWALDINSSVKNLPAQAGQKLKIHLKNIKWMSLSTLFFITLLFTKSRSGIIGFWVADMLFWALSLFSKCPDKEKFRFVLKQFVICNLSFGIIALAIGTPWTPSINQIFNVQSPNNSSLSKTQEPLEPALEVGGTASSEIRKIVWKGAFDIFKANPLFGTGVETFAYSYFLYRPKEHNLISEWDFLYNKAHNEYLNYLATTGILGLGSYLLLIFFSILQISNSKFIISKQFPIFKFKNSLGQLEQLDICYLKIALFAGYISILVTNFFGFSVVLTSFLFFLFPAMAITLEYQDKITKQYLIKVSPFLQKIAFLVLVLLTFWFLFAIGKYWYADVLYAQGKNLDKTKNYPEARLVVLKATKLTPNVAIYWDELSQSSSGLAIDYYQTNNIKEAKIFSETAISESNYALELSPRNLNLRKNNAALFIKLSNLDPKLLVNAEQLIKNTIAYSPTDAKLYYNLGLIQARLDKPQEAISTLEKAVELKANYRDARLALAILYKQNGLKNKAKEQLLYILKNINPQDELVKQQLQEI